MDRKLEAPKARHVRSLVFRWRWTAILCPCPSLVISLGGALLYVLGRGGALTGSTVFEVWTGRQTYICRVDSGCDAEEYLPQVKASLPDCTPIDRALDKMTVPQVPCLTGTSNGLKVWDLRCIRK